MNKTILVLLVILAAIGLVVLVVKPAILVVGPSSDQEQGEETTRVEDTTGDDEGTAVDDVVRSDEDLINEAFAEKYSKQIEEVNALISEKTVNHAKGGVSFEGEMGGGWFLAAKEGDGWVIVADGNGTVSCEDIESYDFPITIVPECWNETTRELLTR